MPNFVKIGQTVVEISRFNAFFKMAAVRHLGLVRRTFGPFTMTTWLVSIVMRNLVKIDAVVLITCEFQYLAS